MINRKTLRYNNLQIEKEFRTFYVTKHLSQTRIALIIGAILSASYYPFDKAFLPANMAETATQFRFLFMVPVPLVLGIITTTRMRITWNFYYILSAGNTAFALFFVWVAYEGGVATTLYGAMGFMQSLLFMTVVLRIPFSMVVLPSIVCTTLMLIQMLEAIASEPSWLNVAPMIAVTAIVSLIALYQTESSERQLWLRERNFSHERQERVDWLENLAKFLRHEARNSMLGVDSSLTLLERSAQEKQKPILNRAQTALQRLRELVTAVVSASSLESMLSKAPRDIVALDELIETRIDNLPASQNIRFDNKTSVSVMGSPTHLPEIWDNLLNNALEHSIPKSEIKVSLVKHGRTALISVENEGDPLPEHADEIFSLFSTSKDRTNEHSHLGLGLYVAKKVAESHGGKISATNLESGVRFQVTLPIYDNKIR